MGHAPISGLLTGSQGGKYKTHHLAVHSAVTELLIGTYTKQEIILTEQSCTKTVQGSAALLEPHGVPRSRAILHKEMERGPKRRKFVGQTKATGNHYNN